MGSTVHVLVDGGDAAALLRAARERVADLEAKWSRFRADSEISRLNAAAGAPVAVSADTLSLITRAIRGWRLTGGRFDPTVHAAMLAHGYDRDFTALTENGSAAPPRALPAPGCAGVRIDRATSQVWLPAGVCFDPGGVGKGLAADLVSAELVRAGATSVLVNVGGDLRVRGRPPEEVGWPVSVADPFDPGRESLRVAITAGGVATSSVLKRRWQVGGHEVHHLIDPRSGAPVEGAVVAVTTFASSAWQAEVWTKAVLVSGRTNLPDVQAVAVTAAGERIATSGLQEVLT